MMTRQGVIEGSNRRMVFEITSQDELQSSVDSILLSISRFQKFYSLLQAPVYHGQLPVKLWQVYNTFEYLCEQTFAPTLFLTTMNYSR